MPRPEAVDQDPEPQVDPAPAEEERADEEEAGGEDSQPRMRAVGEVLVHGACTGEPASVENDHVADREHTQSRDDHGQRRVPAGADIGSRDAPEDQGDREHRADRKRLCDGVDGGEVLFAERAFCRGAGGVYLAHGDILQGC